MRRARGSYRIGEKQMKSEKERERETRRASEKMREGERERQSKKIEKIFGEGYNWPSLFFCKKREVEKRHLCYFCNVPYLV